MQTQNSRKHKDSKSSESIEDSERGALRLLKMEMTEALLLGVLAALLPLSEVPSLHGGSDTKNAARRPTCCAAALAASPRLFRGRTPTARRLSRCLVRALASATRATGGWE